MPGIIILLMCSLFLFSAIVEAAEIRIASASNFYPTLNKIKQSYEKNSEDKIKIIRGSTGKLYAQIMQGAPYDIFLSADSERADKLVVRGKSYDKKSYVYATGQLALWKADADSSQQLREQLYDGRFRKLAVANPKTAPYGRAAIEALQAMELYEKVKDRLVYGENISQTLQFVQSGAADLGFVARSYVIHDMYWQIDDYLHKPLEQKMLILKQTKQPDSAKKFIEYMQTDEVKKIISTSGYLN